jgi:hypothetical protein
VLVQTNAGLEIDNGTIVTNFGAVSVGGNVQIQNCSEVDVDNPSIEGNVEPLNNSELGLVKSNTVAGNVHGDNNGPKPRVSHAGRRKHDPWQP